MIYIYNIANNKFVKEVATVRDAATHLHTTQAKVKEVLEGHTPHIGNRGLIEMDKTSIPPTLISKATYYMQLKEQFYELTLSQCTWEDCVVLKSSDTEIDKKSTTLQQAIKLLNQGYIAIPF